MIHVLHLAYAVSQGGAANVIVTLCNGLDPGRFRASIITLTPNGGFERLLAPGITLRRLIVPRGIRPDVVVRLAQQLRELRPDVMHSHAWGPLCEGWAAARLAGVPVVMHTEHGTLELRPLNRRIQRWVWGWHDQIVAVSDVLRRRMVHHIGYPAERIQVIPNGIDTDRLSFDSARRRRVREQLGAGDQDFVVGAVGRLHPVKGHRFLLEAVALLPPHVRLWLVGDGELRAELESLAASLSLSDRVRFLGHRDDVPDLFPGMDAYCQPSLSEGISMALLEAMASRRPVIVTAVGGNLEVVAPGATGLVVEAAKPGALVDAVRRLMGFPEEAERLAEAARRDVIARFSRSLMVGEHEELYERLLARRKPRRP